MENKIPSPYIVPFDFTPVSDAAVQQALNISRTTGAPIQLLHVVELRNESDQAQKKLDAAVAKLNLTDADPQVEGKVIAGSIYEDISKIADYTESQLIVMGTHGAHGFQRIFGSRAIKVITSSSVPFVVVQKGTQPRPYKRIVVPVDLTKESISVMRFAKNIAKEFGATVHVVGAHQGDAWFEKKVRANIKLVDNYLQKEGVSSVVKMLDGNHAYEKEVMNYAELVDADLIALGYFSESILPQFDSFAQSLITNERQTPVLIINAEEIGRISSQYTFIGV